MASRVGHHWLRRVSRLFASDSISRAASTSDFLTASHSGSTLQRAYAPVRSFEARLPNSATRSSNSSQFRYLCSAPKDVDSSNRSISVQDSSLDSAVTKSEEEQQSHNVFICLHPCVITVVNCSRI